MKVLLINSLYFPNNIGGAEISTQILAEGLYGSGHEPVVVTVSDKEHIDTVNNVKIYYISYSNLYFFISSKKYNKVLRMLWHIADTFNPVILYKIKRIIKSEKPDIAHTNNLLGLSVSAWKILRKNKIPIIHTIRDYYLLCWRSSMFNRGRNCHKQCWSCKILSAPKKYFSKYVDRIVGISSFILKQHLQSGYFGSIKKEVIYNPIKPGFLKAKSINKPLKFGYIGTISKSKGAFFLMDVFSGLNNNQIKLLIYGNARDKKNEKVIKDKYEKDNIYFCGFEDPAIIFREIDVLIVPSLWNEPLSRVILESYSNGVPVIASERGGIREIVEDGKTGFLFDPCIGGDLEEKIKRFTDDTSQIFSMSVFCLEKAKEFSQKRITEKYINVYNNLLNDNMDNYI